MHNKRKKIDNRVGFIGSVEDSKDVHPAKIRRKIGKSK
jgi:hypothetical protein